MDNLLIEWVGEDTRSFSVVSIDRLADGALKSSGRKLIGKTLSIIWTRGKEYLGRILNIGQFDELNVEADERAAQVSVEEMSQKAKAGKKRGNSGEDNNKAEIKTRKSRRNGSPDCGKKIAEILSQMDYPNTEDIQIADHNETSVNDETYDLNEASSYKGKYKSLKIKYRELKAKYKDLLTRADQTSEVG